MCINGYFDYNFIVAQWKMWIAYNNTFNKIVFYLTATCLLVFLPSLKRYAIVYGAQFTILLP